MSEAMKCKTSDYVPWNDAMRLINCLFNDKKYRLSLLVGCGCFFGLRISDLKKLSWSMLLDDDKFTIREQKTSKKRTVKINAKFKEHIVSCYLALGINDKSEPCFLSRKKKVFTTQRINVLLKEMRDQYNIDCKNFSCHSLRKSFGRKIVESAGKDSEMALIKLSELFNHSSVQTTRRYLGLRAEELEACYDMLDF